MKSKNFFCKPFSWLFMLTCLLLPILAPSLGAETITLNLSAGNFRLETTETGETRIVMLTQDYGNLQSPADPLLPQRIIEVAVPQSANLSDLSLSLDSQEVIDFPTPVDIVPQPPDMFAQPTPVPQPVPPDPAIIPKFFGNDKSIVNGRNIRVYNRDAFFPAQAIELLPTITKKEINIEEGRRTTSSIFNPTFSLNKVIRVLYKPFLYNPVQRRLRLINKATITLTYNIIIPRVTGANQPPDTIFQANGSADYVIVTSNNTVASSTRLADFVRMKQLEGHVVRIVTENDFGGLTGQAPNGTAEKIRQWLIDNYISLGIDYVLLIGNPDPDDTLDPNDTVGDIPMKMCFPLYFEPFYRESPTDYFYADLTGNWDLDGNQIYGVDLPRNHEESPDPSIAPDTFSARWTGRVNIDFNENYTFSTFSDDGVRVFLDGNLIIDNFTLHPPTLDSSAPQLLTIGQHNITVEFFENTVHAVMKLYWQTTNSNNVGLAIIPADHLFFQDSGGNFVAGGLNATYFNTVDLTGPVALTRIDDVLNFIWGTGDNGPGEREPGAEVFVGRIPVYNNNFTDLDSILGKIIRYETDAGDISWRSKLLLPMEPSDPDTNGTSLGEGIRNDYALAAGFTVFRIYDDDFSSSGGPTPELFPCNIANVLGEWQNGYGMVTWWTHGSSQGAADVFDSSQAPNLDNTKPSFTFQTSCSNGEPEDTNNLGYALLKNGAVATVSASRVSWYGGGTTAVNQPSNDLNECFAYSYTKNAIDNGIPLAAGVALATTKGNFTAIHMNGMDYNLYGEPDCFLLQTNPNQPPVADADGPYTANEGGSVTLNGSGSFDPEGDALLYRWDLDNDGTFDTAFSASPTFVLTSGDNFVRTVRLQVRDSLGLTGEATALVTFLNVDPTASIDSISQPNPLAIFTGQTLTLTGSFSDPGWLDTHTSLWDFGDGTTASGTLTEENIQPDATGTTTVNKVYTRPGTYTITLTIRDDDGGIGTDTRVITVLGSLQTTGSIILADRSRLIAPACSGGTFTEVGADALIRTTVLLVNGNVTLRSRARIEGNVEISGTVQRQDGTVITGTLLERVPVTIGAIPVLTVTIGTTDLTVNNDQTTSWSPGNYRDGMVRARGRVTLTSGTYNFRRLEFEPDSVLVLNAAAGPIIINADQQLGFGDRSVRVVNGNANNVSFYTNSTGTLRIGTDNQLSAGSIIAPRATIQVSSRSTVRGIVAANILRTEPDCTIDSTP